MICAALPKWRVKSVARFKSSSGGGRKRYAEFAAVGEMVCLERVAAGKKIAEACDRGWGREDFAGGVAVMCWNDGCCRPVFWAGPAFRRDAAHAIEVELKQK